MPFLNYRNHVPTSQNPSRNFVSWSKACSVVNSPHRAVKTLHPCCPAGQVLIPRHRAPCLRLSIGGQIFGAADRLVAKSAIEYRPEVPSFFRIRRSVRPMQIAASAGSCVRHQTSRLVGDDLQPRPQSDRRVASVNPFLSRVACRCKSNKPMPLPRVPLKANSQSASGDDTTVTVPSMPMPSIRVA